MKKTDIPLFMHNCIKNAENLIEDATILFDSMRYPRAFALAHLGCEEIVKAAILHVVDLFGNDEDVKGVDLVVRNHERKLRALSKLEFLIAGYQNTHGLSETYQDDRLSFVKKQNMLKNVALYACELEGKQVAPIEVFDKEYVSAYLLVSRQRLKFGRQFCNFDHKDKKHYQFWDGAYREFFLVFRD